MTDESDSPFLTESEFAALQQKAEQESLINRQEDETKQQQKKTKKKCKKKKQKTRDEKKAKNEKKDKDKDKDKEVQEQKKVLTDEERSQLRIKLSAQRKMAESKRAGGRGNGLNGLTPMQTEVFEKELERVSLISEAEARSQLEDIKKNQSPLHVAAFREIYFRAHGKALA